MFLKKFKEKIKINKYLNLIDFIFLCTFFIISIGLFIILNDVNIIFRSIISLSFMFTISLGLYKINDESIYKKILILIKFIFRNKLKNNENIYYIENEILICKKMKSKKIYLDCFEIKGYNLLSCNNDIIEKNLFHLKNAFNSINENFTIIKIDQNINLEKSNNFLNSKGINSNKFSKEILKGYIFNQTNKETGLEINSQNSNFYLVIYYNDINSLIDARQKIKNKFSFSQLSIENINSNKLINIIKTYHDPSSPDYNNELINKNKENINNLINFDLVNFNVKFAKTNDLYFSLGSISDYPVKPDLCWLWKLTNSNSNFLLNFHSLKKEIVEIKLNNILLNLKTNLAMLNEKNKSEILKCTNLIEEYKELITQVSINDEEIKSMNLIAINYGSNINELQMCESIIKNICRDQGFKYNPLTFLQHKAFNSLDLIKLNDNMNDTRILLSTQAIANSFPFIDTNLIDDYGCYLGKEYTNNLPIIFDQFTISDYRRNHNMIVFGSSGNGKTTLIKKLICFNRSIGRDVIILDPENEYYNLVNLFNGSQIDCVSSTNNQVINPLQIFITYKNDETDNLLNTNRKIIANHINLLENWFNILYPSIDLKEKIIIKNTLNELYSDIKFQINFLDSLNDWEWPTMIDFYNILIKNKSLYDNNWEYNFVVNIIESDFLETKRFYYLFSKQSKIINLNNLLTCFNTYGLFDMYSSSTSSAILYIMINYIFNQIKRNRIVDNKQTLFVIDESYLFLDNKNPIILDFIYQLTKRIRKYNSGIILITQNLNDFLANNEIKKQTTALMNNIQYSMIFNLQSEDLNNLIELYKNSNPITDFEKEKISKAKKGDMLFINHGLNRIFLNVDILESEKKGVINE